MTDDPHGDIVDKAKARRDDQRLLIAAMGPAATSVQRARAQHLLDTLDSQLKRLIAIRSRAGR